MSISEEYSGLNSFSGKDRSVVHVLMTGGGAPGAAGILKCLQQDPSFRIFIADASPDAVGRRLINREPSGEFILIPPAVEKDFIPSLLTICREHNIQAVLPLVTKELLHLAENKEFFDHIGCRLIISPYTSLKIANNKCRLYETLQKGGIPVPEFRCVNNISGFREAADFLHYPVKPFCFKPAVSNGSRGFRIVMDKIDQLDLLLHHKPGNARMNMNHAVDILSSGDFPELLVSEFLPGMEYSVDCLAKNGEPVLVIPRSRKKMVEGISVEGEFVKEDNIIDYCSSIIRFLHLHGIIGIQVKQKEDGQFLILEVNPRVQGTASAALGAGVNLPVLAVKQEWGIPVDARELKVRWGTKFSRYWNEVFYE